jgi:hypothetical protein
MLKSLIKSCVILRYHHHYGWYWGVRDLMGVRLGSTTNAEVFSCCWAVRVGS